ncbi:hypothetical protein ACOSQ3_019413 [Xanthoceras sorbifolium]
MSILPTLHQTIIFIIKDKSANVIKLEMLMAPLVDRSSLLQELRKIERKHI